MVALIQSADPRVLLPPLLACLPTAFASPRPPPALLSILSPILRQRVQVFSSVSNSPTNSWLRFLCWDDGKSERLEELIENSNFEPHPVSGEIDLPGDIPVAYKRIDEETLQSQISLSDYGLQVISLWCPDDNAGDGPGWKVAEVVPQKDSSNYDDTWYLSISEADANAKQNLLDVILKQAEEKEQRQLHGNGNGNGNGDSFGGGDGDDDDDDDDAYWAQYDATPGATPSAKESAAPVSTASYFDRYDDVQPVMDNYDPSEAGNEHGESSLNGDLLTGLLRRELPRFEPQGPARKNGYPSGTTTSEDVAMSLNHPRPSSASSDSSNAVARLEQEAEAHSASEVGVKQHIRSSIQSLFELAKSTGISQPEFQSLVKMELDSLEHGKEL